MTISERTRKDVYARDGFRCSAEGLGCTRFISLTLQHRINRGAGGSLELARRVKAADAIEAKALRG